MMRIVGRAAAPQTPMGQQRSVAREAGSAFVRGFAAALGFSAALYLAGRWGVRSAKRAIQANLTGALE